MAKKKSKSKPPAKPKGSTLKQTATALHLSERRVQQLVAEGLPRAQRGAYDLDKCLRWYVRYLQKKLAERALPDPDGGSSATAVTRHKLLSIEAELKHLELAEKRGTIVSIERVEKDLAAIALEIKSRILTAAPRLAGEVVGKTDRTAVEDAINRALRECLVDLSKYDPSLAAPGAAGVPSNR